MARQAGDLALAAGETDRAKEAWSMARLQWVTLNCPDEVAETTRRIEWIADASRPTRRGEGGAQPGTAADFQRDRQRSRGPARPARLGDEARGWR